MRPMSEQHEHVDLMVAGAPAGATQPVEVEPLGAGEYRILYSPGWVEGIAAGDTIRVTDTMLGRFEVLSRGRNLAIKFTSPQPVAQILPSVSTELEAIGGRLDGSIERAAVWTVPVSAGFERIEAIMTAAAARIPGSGWWYGNVYDESGEPLRWWEQDHPTRGGP